MRGSVAKCRSRMHTRVANEVADGRPGVRARFIRVYSTSPHNAGSGTPAHPIRCAPTPVDCRGRFENGLLGGSCRNASGWNRNRSSSFRDLRKRMQRRRERWNSRLDRFIGRLGTGGRWFPALDRRVHQDSSDCSHYKERPEGDVASVSPSARRSRMVHHVLVIGSNYEGVTKPLSFVCMNP